MKKVSNFKAILLVITFLLIIFDLNNYKKINDTYPTYFEIDKKTQKLDIKRNDKIEDIVGKNDKLSDFYLNLKSNKGSNQATHPKIIKFKKKWNGYKYWVAYTPYPYGNQAEENPYVLVSNDMLNWKEKKGMKNPLDIPKSKDYKHVYNSDTHLVYNSDTDTLECFFRYVNDNENIVIIYKRTTRNGVDWTNKEIVLKANRKQRDYLSPAVIYENKKYKIWFVDRNRIIKYMEYDVKNKTWTEPIVIDIKYSEKLESWHLDIIKTDKGYEAIIVAFNNWKNRAKMKLYYSYSKDNITWEEAKPILTAPNNGGIYRSSFLYENGTYYLLYSEITNKYKRGIGLLYGTDINKLNGLELKNTSKFIQYVKKNG